MVDFITQYWVEILITLYLIVGYSQAIKYTTKARAKGINFPFFGLITCLFWLPMDLWIYLIEE